jgi:DNA polymerase-4
VRAVLADHPDEKTISLLAISVSHFEEHWNMQLELPLGLKDDARRPGTKKGMARWVADRAVDRIRWRFWPSATGYQSALFTFLPIPMDYAPNTRSQSAATRRGVVSGTF